jgi:hypothetical protein
MTASELRTNMTASELRSGLSAPSLSIAQEHQVD